jgi:23S rRNA G2445 N2-methylase RlmL
MDSPLIKVSFISGLRNIVLDEISKHQELVMHHQLNDDIFLELPSSLEIIRGFKSITNAFIVKQDTKLNPRHINSHKSILGELIEQVLLGHEKEFKTFTLSCAGSDSDEIKSIIRYISTQHKLTQAEDADLKIHIGKSNEIWEIGVCLTPRPLSVRSYRVVNIEGGMNPTIAYALNSFCDLEHAKSYLNVFSGGATLLIEAGLINKNLKLQGFDIDGKRNSEAVKNIKEAGLIKNISLKTADIYENPEFGMFDVIVSDLPFGQLVGKNDNLEDLYQAFINYCESHLNPKGRLGVYTSEHKLVEEVIESSRFEIKETITLKLLTSVNSYLYPKIFICEFK